MWQVGVQVRCADRAHPLARAGDAWRGWVLPAEGTHLLSITGCHHVLSTQHLLCSGLGALSCLIGELLCKDKVPSLHWSHVTPESTSRCGNRSVGIRGSHRGRT